MSNPTPDESPPPPPPSPTEPSSFDQAGTPSPATSDGCSFIFGLLGGFVLFLIAGFFVLAISGRVGGTVGPIYLAIAGIGAVALAFKPNWRGFAIGVLLGVGAVLLLIAICSGMQV